MSIGNAIILGLVQGIAEFLPISSSGHLSILQNLFGLSGLESNLFFDVLLHIGTLVAILFAYWSDIAQMAKEVLAMLRGETSVVVGGKRRPLYYARMFLLICVATLPLALIVPINDYIDILSGKTGFVGIALILTACILLVSDKMEQGNKSAKDSLFKDALLIGLCQCVATLPGISRSGVTISAGIATGHRREYAVKFSLLMSIPAVLAATLLELVKAIKAGIDVSLIPAYLVGMVVAMISGVFSIRVIRTIAKRGGFGGFAHYCLLAGVLTIVLTLVF
ncbi:MAG: undecaprenyl-diphosphate phosphatase [Oscillospiraceae bacterium]|nr:undecaprenyl-diphosphate phosphatase [Oscillospiraceae bacterium]